MNSWCQNNKSKFSLLQLSLIEGQHYFISIFNDASGALKCDIKCCCEKWSSLTLRREKFQLSNFYRHLQGLSNVCPELKKMINSSQLPLPSTTNTQQSLTTSNNVPQQVASPSFIPIIPPTDTSSSLQTKRQVKRKVQTIESSYNTRESTKRTRRG